MRWCFFVILLFSLSFGAGERCGTQRFIEELKKNPQKRKALKKDYLPSYIVVHSKLTKKNFIIYYVTEGTDAIRTTAYIDSLAKYLEDAYEFHQNTLGMKRISGATQTAFYEQAVPSGRYPIEVIDTGDWWDQWFCGTYGITLPYAGKTQIAIENDFIYGAACRDVGKRKGDPFTSSINGDYSKNWHLALKVTVFHELYHSFQMTQFDFEKYQSSFWAEASATGVEEIGVPEVNDYIDYVRSYPIPGKSMENLESGYEYAYATLYLFLSSELGLKFDSYIWDSFKNYPQKTFAEQLALYLNLQKEEGEDVEDLFHKYASHIFYSGARAASSPYKLFSDDMQKWPTWIIKGIAPQYLPSGTFDFIRHNGTTSYTDSVARFSSLNDSVWVLSRLLSEEFIPPPPLPPPLKEFAAYPNPWKPKQSEKVKFGPLPNSGGVEIRSSNGTLLKRIEGKFGDTLTWQPEKLPAPGVLYYRTLPYGKNKMLILER